MFVLHFSLCQTPATGYNRRIEQTAAEKGGVRMCRIHRKGLCADRKGTSTKPGGGSSLKGITGSTRGSFFSVRISRKQKIPDIPLPIYFLILGRHGTVGTGMSLVCCGQNCWGKRNLQLSQIHSLGRWIYMDIPRIFWIQFYLPEWTLCVGVCWQIQRKIWSYVMMQKDYISDFDLRRDDFAVLKLEGKG